MPTYRIPVSFYMEAPTLADAACRLSEYLDDASRAVLPVENVFGVDIEEEKAEECPPVPAED
jgi:hypothetical protein